jgi:hypothetical protein
MIYISDVISIESNWTTPRTDVVSSSYKTTISYNLVKTCCCCCYSIIMNNIILMIYVLRYLIPFSTAKLF